VWAAVSRGEISGAKALLSGAYTATGDLNMLMQFDAMSGGDNQ